jgi:non-specific protein-tyrosine kinase
MKKYIDPLLHWWWLIALCTVLAVIASYFAVQRMPAVYQAQVTLVVGKTYNNPNPTSGDIYLEQQLASIYANIASQGQLNGPTMEALELNSLPEYFVRPVSNTPLIQILVSDVDPVRVAAVANELANQMVRKSPTGSSETDQRQQFINTQLGKIETEIQDTDKKILEANEKLAAADSARQIADIQTLITALSQKRISLQDNYTSFLSSTNEGSSNNITVLQYAVEPTRPVGPNKLYYMLLAAALGLFLAVGASYLVDLIDSRVKSGDEIAEILGSTIIGQIPSIPDENRGFYTDKNPRSPITDTFRTLRTNIEFMSVNQPIKTILITGTEPGIGKTTISSNLAFAFTQQDKRVILVDADLRQPQLHHVLKQDSELGLTDACLGHVPLEKILLPWDKEQALISSADEDGWAIDEARLKFLPAGLLPPNPAELLASTRFDNLLEELSAIADIVIIDSPPVSIPDTSILLSKVDGVLLVFQPKKASRERIRVAKDLLVRSGAKILGLIINLSEIKTDSYYYNYRMDKDKVTPGGRRKSSAPIPAAQKPSIK